MQIIIPMSGIGKRFLDAGYKDPKPLITIDGKTIIEHVINLFSDEKNFIFICNEEHLANTAMKSILESIAPFGKIVSIAPHKLGPVFAVSQAFNLINDHEEVIVNYCDFSTYWDYHDFLAHTRNRHADGAIAAYKNFHPHMLGSTNYAFIKEENQWLTAIKEKEPFTTNRMKEYASNGTYYFRRGSYVKKYFQQLMDLSMSVNNEYYVSLVYNLLAKDGLSTSIYGIQHMLQWGTPEDVEEYATWSDFFRKRIGPEIELTAEPGSISLMPLAGRGQRFIGEGYNAPKPLIHVSGKPMVIQAAAHLPPAEKHIFVCLNDHLHNYPLTRTLSKPYAQAKITSINTITQGQACTCELGLKHENLNAPLLIAACDNGMLWDKKKYQSLIDDPSVDAIVWSFRHHPSSKRHPHMYGWIHVDADNNATSVSVKKPISDNPFNDHAIVGTFYFRKAQYFIDATKSLYQKNNRINNEFYVDSCINELVEQGRTVKVFEVDHYVCWGTPNDLKTFEYWQSFFHKCSWHPYSLDKDPTVSKNDIAALDLQSRAFVQEESTLGIQGLPFSQATPQISNK